MTASNFNLRGLQPEVVLLLKRKAKEEDISINTLILRIIEQGVGYRGGAKRTAYHDIDNLAGTWSEKESQAFEKNIKTFEKIDEELWS